MNVIAIVSLLLALVGPIAVAPRLVLLVAPARAAAALGFGPLERVADGQARFAGVRTVLRRGHILLALAYASGVTGVAGPALAILGATAWGAAQLADVLIFLRLRNQLGALSAGALAVKLAVAALLAWTS